MTLLAGVHKLCFTLLALPLAMGTLLASTYSYFGVGGDLNVATFDSMNNVVVGVTTFSIPVSDLVFVDPGDSVQLSLIGLQYPYAGDLHITLQSPTNATGDVFNHIGAFMPGDPGYATQFGNSILPCSGNYNFDSSYNDDFWAAAARLGSTDSIPCGNYLPTTAFSPNGDNLSFLFAGLPANGIWTLTIYDDYPPFNGDSGPFIPGLSSWELTIQAAPASTSPEPSTVVLSALSALLLWVVRRLRSPGMDRLVTNRYVENMRKAM